MAMLCWEWTTVYRPGDLVSGRDSYIAASGDAVGGVDRRIL